MDITAIFWDKLEDFENLGSAGSSRRMKSKISSLVEAVKYRNKLIMIAENSAPKWAWWRKAPTRLPFGM